MEQYVLLTDLLSSGQRFAKGERLPEALATPDNVRLWLSSGTIRAVAQAPETTAEIEALRAALAACEAELARLRVENERLRAAAPVRENPLKRNLRRPEPVA